MPRKISLVRAAIAGAAIALIIQASKHAPAHDANYWFGVAVGGASLFITVTTIVNRYRR